MCMCCLFIFAVSFHPMHKVQWGLHASGIQTQRTVQPFTPALQEPSVPQGTGPAAPTSLPVASPAISSLPPNAPVAAHMHLLCDMLPCPLQHPPPGRRRRSRSPKEVPTRDPKGRSGSSETESEDRPGGGSSSPPPPSSESPGGERKAGGPRRSAPRREGPERSQKRAVGKVHGKKKSGRYGSGLCPSVLLVNSAETKRPREKPVTTGQSKCEEILSLFGY